MIQIASSPVTKFSSNVFVRTLLPPLAFFGIALANFFVFVVVPSERVMGAVQRIFYFHVGSAVATYAMIGLMLLAAVCYLATRLRDWDLLLHASESVAFLLCTAVLLTGMIWGHSAWNTWWRWEPRLVSFLVLWLILFSALILRSLTGSVGGKERNFNSVLAILAAVNVPIVIFSVKLLDHSEQLHPQVIAERGLESPWYVFTLLLAILSLSLLAVWMVSLKLNNLILREELLLLQDQRRS